MTLLLNSMLITSGLYVIEAKSRIVVTAFSQYPCFGKVWVVLLSLTAKFRFAFAPFRARVFSAFERCASAPAHRQNMKFAPVRSLIVGYMASRDFSGL